MISVTGIPSEDLDKIWFSVESMLDRALTKTVAGNLYSLESVREAVSKQEMQLWLILKDKDVIAMAVTQIIVYPKCKVFDVLFMGGDFYDTWSVLFNDLMREYAKSFGCKFARGYGRLGWARKVKHLGIEPSIYFDVPLEETPHAIH